MSQMHHATSMLYFRAEDLHVHQDQWPGNKRTRGQMVTHALKPTLAGVPGGRNQYVIQRPLPLQPPGIMDASSVLHQKKKKVITRTMLHPASLSWLVSTTGTLAPGSSGRDTSAVWQCVRTTNRVTTGRATYCAAINQSPACPVAERLPAPTVTEYEDLTSALNKPSWAQRDTRTRRAPSMHPWYQA
jgi:hypothetical protein